MAIAEHILNVDRAVLNTVFENTIRRVNFWRLAGETLNITCKFLYCNHQLYTDFLIILYKHVTSPCDHVSAFTNGCFTCIV
jgi:hypothetical protein